MISPNRIVYTPHPDTSPELEAAALAAAYRYILACSEANKAAEAVEASEKGEEGGDHDLDDASE